MFFLGGIGCTTAQRTSHDTGKRTLIRDAPELSPLRILLPFHRNLSNNAARTCLAKRLGLEAGGGAAAGGGEFFLIV